MKKPIVVLGIGELGSVFARAFLKNNYPVYPITRHTNIEELSTKINPELILISTGEADLQTALTQIPTQWKNRVVLMQNELLPRDWALHNFINPTVISVWFEKKQGMDSKVLISSPVYGAKAKILVASLALINIPAHILTHETELLFELVVKNLYILTTNIAGLGLEPNTNVDELRRHHLALMHNVIKDIIILQTQLTGQIFDELALEKSMLKAFEGDPKHICMGRSAPGRLDRALALADKFKLKTPTLQKIKNSL